MHVLHCIDLDAAIAFFTDTQGYRLDMIMPADDPRIAEVSRDGESLRLEVEPAQPAKSATVDAPQFTLTRVSADDSWIVGRAGMHYRDLIPSRLGGRYIASHIRIPVGGPVADYVHFHQVCFQMIYCVRGWVRVVYEDQGEPFVLRAGDCVLQPPTIRHRVIEASDNLEVIEIGAPAEHATFREHDIALPTAAFQPDRRFAGQRFVRHVAADAAWHKDPVSRMAFRDTGIADASGGVASVRVLRALQPRDADGNEAATRVHQQGLLFFYLLEGELEVAGDSIGTHLLSAGDSCVIPRGAPYSFFPIGSCQILEVAVAAEE